MVVKKILPFVFCLFYSFSYAQITVGIDSSMNEINFSKTLKKYNVTEIVRLMQNLSQTNDVGFAPAIQIDTLNKNDLIVYKNIKVQKTGMDIKGNKYNILPYEGKDTLVTLCSVALAFKNDTLKMQILPMLFVGYNTPKFTFNTIKNKLVVVTQADEFNVPIKQIKCKMNTLSFKPGETIYGELEVQTEPYNFENPGFTSNHMRLMYNATYLFKVTIASSQNK